MSAEEMKALIEQAKAGEGDDCLMCDHNRLAYTKKAPPWRCFFYVEI